MNTQITLKENIQITCNTPPSYKIALTPKDSHLKKNFNVYDEIKRINEVGACINKNISVDSFVGLNRYSY